MIRIHRTSTTLLASLALLALPAAGAAQSPVQDQYGNPAAPEVQVPDQPEATPDPTPDATGGESTGGAELAVADTTADTGVLPFTGAELMLILLAGGLLLGSGLMLRRVGFAGSRHIKRQPTRGKD